MMLANYEGISNHNKLEQLPKIVGKFYQVTYSFRYGATEQIVTQYNRVSPLTMRSTGLFHWQIISKVMPALGMGCTKAKRVI